MLNERQEKALLFKKHQHLFITYPFIFNMLMKTLNFKYHYAVSLIFSIILLVAFIYRNIDFAERWYDFSALGFIGKLKVLGWYLFATSMFIVCWGIYIYSFINPNFKCGSPCFYSDTFQKISTSISGMLGNYLFALTVVAMPFVVSER